MSAGKPVRAELRVLRLWHAWIFGAYAVAYVTADENTYAQHLFAGYAVLAAVACRLLVGAILPSGRPMGLPRLARRGPGRNPLFGWIAAALLAAVGLAAFSGVLADAATWMEHAHEALSEFSLWVIAAHVAFVAFTYGGKRWLINAFARIKTEISR